MLHEFFSGFPQIHRADVFGRNSYRELQVEPFDIDREIAANDDGVEFPDGLAYFGRPIVPIVPGLHIYVSRDGATILFR
jgi:hypothetical protein